MSKDFELLEFENGLLDGAKPYSYSSALGLSDVVLQGLVGFCTVYADE